MGILRRTRARYLFILIFTCVAIYAAVSFRTVSPSKVRFKSKIPRVDNDAYSLEQRRGKTKSWSGGTDTKVDEGDRRSYLDQNVASQKVLRGKQTDHLFGGNSLVDEGNWKSYLDQNVPSNEVLRGKETDRLFGGNSFVDEGNWKSYLDQNVPSVKVLRGRITDSQLDGRDIILEKYLRHIPSNKLLRERETDEHFDAKDFILEENPETPDVAVGRSLSEVPRARESKALFGKIAEDERYSKMLHFDEKDLSKKVLRSGITRELLGRTGSEGEQDLETARIDEKEPSKEILRTRITEKLFGIPGSAVVQDLERSNVHGREFRSEAGGTGGLADVNGSESNVEEEDEGGEEEGEEEEEDERGEEEGEEEEEEDDDERERHYKGGKEDHYNEERDRRERYDKGGKEDHYNEERERRERHDRGGKEDYYNEEKERRERYDRGRKEDHYNEERERHDKEGKEDHYDEERERRERRDRGGKEDHYNEERERRERHDKGGKEDHDKEEENIIDEVMFNTWGSIIANYIKDQASGNYKRNQPERMNPISPARAFFPMTPQEALSIFSHKMPWWERYEILHYPKVWYLGLHANKTRLHTDPKKNSAYDEYDEDGEWHYRVVPGDHIAYRYEVIKHLGSGSYGSVIRARDWSDSSGPFVALKLLHIQGKRYHDSKELKIMEMIERNAENLDYFSKVIAKFQFRGHECLVFELLGSTLHRDDRPKHVSQNITTIRRLTEDMLHGLYYAHQIGLIHSDLKPANVMYVYGKEHNNHGQLLKLADFGLSCFQNHKDLGCRISHHVGTRDYRAPELLLEVAYTTQADMWSLGIILVELALDIKLFHNDDEADLLSSMMEILGLIPVDMVVRSPRKKLYNAAVDYRRENGFHRKPYRKPLQKLLAGVDPALFDLIARLLEYEPEKRITAEQALRHPFITGVYPAIGLQPSRLMKHMRLLPE